ncbi:unnamed protein product, partial [Candidula unifasciata]
KRGEERVAVCAVKPNDGSDQPVTGVVTFRQKHGQYITIEVHLEGFKSLPSTANDTEYLHGFHVHATGNLTAGCDSTGGHYNPRNTNHGGPSDAVRHAGDFGNLRQSPDGRVDKTFTDPVATLFGSYSIIGRGLVVHSGEDDLGKGGNANSLINGNAGKRLGCCVIGSA